MANKKKKVKTTTNEKAKKKTKKTNGKKTKSKKPIRHSKISQANSCKAPRTPPRITAPSAGSKKAASVLKKLVTLVTRGPKGEAVKAVQSKKKPESPAVRAKMGPAQASHQYLPDYPFLLSYFYSLTSSTEETTNEQNR